MPAGDFPNQVQGLQAPGVAGDFASANPKTLVVAGPGALLSGLGVIAGVLVQGAVVGRFGWLNASQVDGNNAPAVVNTFGSGIPNGIIRRTMQGLITAYLGSAVQYLQTGFQIEMFSIVDMWVTNAGSGQALPGMKAFANFADGSVQFAAAGATPSGASGSASSIAAGTASVTGAIVNNVLFVSAVGSGTLYPGATLASNAAAGTKVVSQQLPLLAGEAVGGVGRYNLSIPEQTVAAGTVFSVTYGILTVGGTVVGTFGAGQQLSGSSVVAGTTLYQQLTGTPGVAGTYVVDNNTVVGSTAITGAVCVETSFYCMSSGLTGEVVIISRNAGYSKA